MNNPNTEVVKMRFYPEVKVVKVNEEGIEFSDGTVISHYHDQDCCEHVYANWIDWSNDFSNVVEIRSLTIWTVPDAGIRIEFSHGYQSRDFVWFVACYDEQNGYYNSNLEITISTGENALVAVDVSDGVYFNEC